MDTKKRNILGALAVVLLLVAAITLTPLIMNKVSAKCDKGITTGKTLFQANCSSCHTSLKQIRGESKGEFTKTVLNGSTEGAGESSGEAGEAGESAGADISGSMPSFKGVLTRQQIAKIWMYVKNPKKACSGGGGGGPVANPTYDADIKSILSSYCISCHKGASPSAGVKLDTYADAVANASAMKTAVDAGTMPPSGSLAADLVTTIDNWVNNGTPQN
ncbi:MAG: c-type cytochrome [Candidatus Schekmanbacteria bacterium]|nr:c-type cytochrome [Candidatus Schekmanbacteria bacterium]